MDIKHRKERSATFDASAAYYERARPGYPDDAIRTLIKVAGLTPESQCLEVGVGTGQATRKLAPLGCQITGLEPGANLASTARATLSDFSNVSILNRSFEDYNPEGAVFDLLYSATAFHWTDPETRWERAAALVRPGGYLAILVNKSLEEEQQTPFFVKAQPIYRKYTRDKTKGFDAKNTTASLVPAMQEQIEVSPDFNIIHNENFAFEHTLTSQGLVELHLTFSDHLLLPEVTRNALLAELKDLADREFGGQVSKPYETNLIIAERS